VARAKSTERAEARRRYRAYLQEQAEAEGGHVEEDVGPGSQTAARRAAPPRPRWSGRVRESDLLGTQQATRPVHYFDDLRYAPTLIFKTNAIWPAGTVQLRRSGIRAHPDRLQRQLHRVILNFALPITPLVQPMLAGFLAPRATWLAGLISGVISGLCFEFLIIWYYTSHMANLPANVTLSSSDYVPSRSRWSSLA